MPTNHYNQGEREFTLRVISPLNGEIPFRAGAIDDPDKNPMYIELNLNPSNRIYENPNKKMVQG